MNGMFPDLLVQSNMMAERMVRERRFAANYPMWASNSHKYSFPLSYTESTETGDGETKVGEDKCDENPETEDKSTWTEDVYVWNVDDDPELDVEDWEERCEKRSA